MKAPIIACMGGRISTSGVRAPMGATHGTTSRCGPLSFFSANLRFDSAPWRLRASPGAESNRWGWLSEPASFVSRFRFQPGRLGEPAPPRHSSANRSRRVACGGAASFSGRCRGKMSALHSIHRVRTRDDFAVARSFSPRRNGRTRSVRALKHRAPLGGLPPSIAPAAPKFPPATRHPPPCTSMLYV
jgi:hypothetical protein